MITGSGIKLQPRGAPAVKSTVPRRPQVRAGIPSRHVAPRVKRGTKTTGSKKTAPVPAVKELSIREQAMEELAKERDESRSGHSVVRFNHYKEAFEVRNGVMEWAAIEEKYSFDFLYAGEYNRDLFEIEADPFGRTGDLHSPVVRKVSRTSEGDLFINVKINHTYKVLVSENETDGLKETGLRINEGGLKLTECKSDSRPKENLEVKELTNELLKMDVADLHSAEAKALREARDVADILYN